MSVFLLNGRIAVLCHFKFYILTCWHFGFLDELGNFKQNIFYISKCNFFLHFTATCLLQSTYISTLSTLTPHGSVASSKEDCMTWLMVSLSDKISAKFLVPKTFLSVVAANSRVEWLGEKCSFLYRFKIAKYCLIVSILIFYTYKNVTNTYQ